MSRSRWSVLVLSSVLASALGTSRAWAGDPSPPVSATQTVDLENKVCPVKGRPVAPGVTATVDGAVVHFCCVGCKAKYEANPSAYESALRSDAAVALRLDQAHAMVAAAPEPAPAPASPSAPLSPKELAFHDAMRKLWEDHVVWTRLFIVSAADGLPDKDATAKRLLRNQEDIGNGIKPFYGDAAGTKLTALLKEHITIAADLVGASVAGDSAKAEAAKTKWGANADEIATFLSGANPTAWPLADAKAMMREHLDLTAAEATARIKKDWDADIAAYDKVHEQALKMADMLSDGIRKQFPQKFQ